MRAAGAPSAPSKAKWLAQDARTASDGLHASSIAASQAQCGCIPRLTRLRAFFALGGGSPSLGGQGAKSPWPRPGHVA